MTTVPGTLSPPAQSPDTLQLLDHTGKWQKAGSMFPNSGVFMPTATGSIDVTTIWMQPGGFDNYPLVQKLMDAISPPAGTNGGVEILFPPIAGQGLTYYYFSQPFVIARGSRINCKGLSYDGPGPVELVFPPGVDGLVQEWGTLTPDAGWGLSEVQGCAIVSLGGGSIGAGMAPGATNLTQVALQNDIGYDPNFTMPASCNPYPGYGECTVGVGDGLILFSGWQPPNMAPAVAPGTYVTASDPSARTLTLSSPIISVGLYGGTYPVGSGYMWDLPASQKYAIRTTPSYVTQDATASSYNSTTGDLAMTFATAPYGPTFPADPCFQMQVDSFAGTGADLAQLTGFWYVTSITSSGTTVHLQAPKGLTVTSLSGGRLYSSPVGLAGNALCVVSGPRLMKPGDMIWSDAYLFGSTATAINNHIAGTPTVHSGGSGYVGTSGTMTYQGVACTSGAYPVLNVTASGGVITGVTGVADRGNCIRFTPPSGDAQWIAGGGLSGGSGASFDTTYNEAVFVNCVVVIYCPETALHVYPVGSATGQAWTIPVGLVRRTEGSAEHNHITYFGFGIVGSCEAGFAPPNGCNRSSDQKNEISNTMIGRMMRGDNTGVSNSISNNFGYNSVADEAELGTIGSTYIGEEYNSAENGTARNDFLGLCGTQNFSMNYGMYYSGIDGGYCIGMDAQGRSNLGTGVTQDQGSMLFVGPIYFGAPLPSIGPTAYMNGIWKFAGTGVAPFPATAAVPAGENFIPLNNSFAIRSGDIVTDQTNPSVIPDNTTVTISSGGGVQISNNITGTGVQLNDSIRFQDTAGRCISMNAGITGWSGVGVAVDCNNFFGINYNGYYDTWDFGGIHITNPASAGYTTTNGVPWLQSGLLLGDADGGNVGVERLIDTGDGPSGNNWNIPGNFRFNNTPQPGATVGWMMEAISRNLVTVAAPTGSSTITIDGCPAPLPPVGTAIVGESSGSRPRVSIVPKAIGTMASCVGTTLTLQAPSTGLLDLSTILDFAAWRPAAPIANDVNGLSWSLGNNVHLTPVAFASLPSPCSIGTFAVISDGTPTYDAPAAGGGSEYAPVFCSNGSVWKYH